MIKFTNSATAQPTESTANQKMPEYRTIEKISISKNILASIIKFCENPVNKQIEGILFGHEEEHEVIVETALPLSQNYKNLSEETFNMVSNIYF